VAACLKRNAQDIPIAVVGMILWVKADEARCADDAADGTRAKTVYPRATYGYHGVCLYRQPAVTKGLRIFSSVAVK